MEIIHISTEEKYSIVGFLVYCVIFIFLIPYLLLRNKQYSILSVYFPNLDNLATALGYMGGPPILMPGEFWRFLRESCEENLFEFISVSIIHYTSLLGLTFIIAHYTNKYKSISKGWSLAFFLLFITYILPTNIILKAQDMFGESLNNYVAYGSVAHYVPVAIVGVLIVFGLITIEEKLIHRFSDSVATLIRVMGYKFDIIIN